MSKGAKIGVMRNKRVAKIYSSHSSFQANPQKARAYLKSLSSPQQKLEKFLDSLERERRTWKF